MSALDALFAPRSIVVLGVSRNPTKLGFRLLQNLRDGAYGGTIFPVNPSGEAILGCATVRTVEALPEGIDLALVSLPASAVPDAVRALAARRARAAVILSSGFGEVDAGGRDAERELLGVARAAGLRLVGPNCMGVYSAPARLNGTYFWDLPRLAGGIGVVSQSGAYGGLIFRHLGGRGLGVARFLSIGNQADVGVAEVVEYLADDPATTLVACFIEALRDGRRFVEAAARAAGAKPVVVLKGGRSEAGRRAAGSHTGALAGAYDVYRAAFRHAGVVLAEETEEFFDAIEALVVSGPRRPAAPAIAVITVSGGPSVVAADAAERAGLDVPALDPSARHALRALLPSFAAVGNPVDLTPQVEPARIAAAVRVVLDQPAVAGAVAVNVGLDFPEFADGLVAASRATGKPLVAFTADAPGITARFTAGGVPVLPSPERAVRAWRALWLAGRGPVRGVARPVALPADVEQALAHVRGPLPYALARRALEAVGIVFCREILVTTAEDAIAAAATLGYPVVVKADAPALTHKTEAGGVRLGLRDPAGVRAAAEDLLARLGAPRVIVQEMVGPGVEVLVGGRRDETFGPVVALGAGGILTEVVRDVSLRLAPLDAGEARAMLREGVRARLLAGPRGLPAVDDAPLVGAVLAVADLLMAVPRIVEIDVNPLLAAGGAAVAVDALVVLGEHGG
ncbi:MAG: acetate--CoA ligase family protein [Candidatus Rokubacteria bacterium]|nr:acetate--CoA ligase family protein [Candidatus Rokubacteria bacterium]MBI3825710.1 acetate--CoA ligase family protein [Candidatus Rokubacteria bacterium]